MRKRRTEEQHQCAFVDWFRRQYPMYRKLINLASFGENIGPKRMDRLKLMGLTPGYPDLFLAVAMGEKMVTDSGEFWYDLHHGLYIEMKTKTGKVSAIQAEIHEELRDANYQVEVARSWDEAKEIVIDYLN